MAEIFVSYARLDMDIVQPLVDRLKQHYDVWFDLEDIYLSEDWWQSIREGIQDCHTILFMTSTNSLISAVCTLELDYALQQNMRLIPVILETPDDDAVARQLEATETEGLLEEMLAGRQLLDISNHNRLEVQKINWLFYTADSDKDASFNTLLEILATNIDYVRLHGRIQQRAIQWDTNHRNDSFLLRGADLQHAETLLQSPNDNQPVTALQNEYLLASRKAQQSRTRLQLGFVSGALVVTLGLMILSFILYQQALRSADESRSLALASASQFASQAGDGDLAIQLALTANTIDSPPSLAESALLRSAYATGTRQLFDEQEDLLTTVDVSSDGQYVASGSIVSAIVMVWDIDTGDVVAQRSFAMDQLGAGFIDQILFVPDTDTLLIADATGLILWDYVSDTILWTVGLDGDISNTASAIEFVDDGQIVVGWLDGDVTLHDVTTADVVSRLGEHRATVTHMAVSADGEWIATAGEGDDIKVWSVTEQTEVYAWSVDASAVRAIAFYPDDFQLLIADMDQNIALWDIVTGERRRDLNLGNVLDIQTTDDGLSVLFAIDNGSVILYDARTLSFQRAYRGHTGAVNALVLHPSRKEFFSASSDGDVRHWYLQTPAEVRRDTVDGIQNLSEIDIHPNGEVYAVGVGEIDRGDVLIKSMETGEEIDRIMAHEDSLLTVEYSPSGQYLLTTGFDGGVVVWDAGTYQPILRLETDNTSTLDAILNDDETVIFVAGTNFPETSIGFGVITGNVRAYDLATGDVLWAMEADSSFIAKLKYLSDEQALIMAGWITKFDEGNVALLQIVDATTGDVLRQIDQTNGGHDSPIYWVDMTSDGQTLVTSSEDRTLIQWDMETETVARRFVGHEDSVTNVLILPDDETFVSASDDGTVRVWSLITGDLLATFDGHTGRARELAYDQNRDRLLSVGDDGTIRWWRLDLDPESIIDWVQANRYLREFTCTEREQYQIEPLCG